MALARSKPEARWRETRSVPGNASIPATRSRPALRPPRERTRPREPRAERMKPAPLIRRSQPRIDRARTRPCAVPSVSPSPPRLRSGPSGRLASTSAGSGPPRPASKLGRDRRLGDRGAWPRSPRLPPPRRRPRSQPPAARRDSVPVRPRRRAAAGLARRRREASQRRCSPRPPSMWIARVPAPAVPRRARWPTSHGPACSGRAPSRIATQALASPSSRASSAASSPAWRTSARSSLRCRRASSARAPPSPTATLSSSARSGVVEPDPITNLRPTGRRS
jgi:hypothetical protein